MLEGLDGKGVELAVLKVLVELELIPVARVVGIAHHLVVEVDPAGAAAAYIEEYLILLPDTIHLNLAGVDYRAVRAPLFPTARELHIIWRLAVVQLLYCAVIVIGHNIAPWHSHKLRHGHHRHC